MPRVGTSTGRRRPLRTGRPVPGRREFVVAGLLICAAVAEGALRRDLAWPVVTTVATALLLAGLPWRRRHPLALVLAVTGVTAALDVAQHVAGVAGDGLVVSFVVLLAPYSLFRWGTTTARRVGTAALVVGVLLSAVLGPERGGGALIGAVVGILLVGCAGLLGAVRRERAARREQELVVVRVQEREALARELHDAVGHHVSAIAIRAQATAFSVDDPRTVSASLVVIENEARMALTEMRSLVGTLRAPADDGPAAGIADLGRFATEGPPRVTVAIGATGTPSQLVEGAVYRMAQEAVTNARRHGRDVTEIAVAVHAESDGLHLRVRDDGKDSAAGSPGWGLVGVEERAALLGGTVDAGPQDDGGWLLHAHFPRGAE